LILCEKPSAARAFAEALGCAFAKGKGYYRNDAHVVTYCVGHLYKLFDPGDYREEWRKWSLEELPILPERYRYKKNEGSAAQADVAVGLIKAHKDKEILIATDAGREGELIARIALREAGLTDISRCKRFWVSEALTPGAIRRGIASAGPLSDYDGLAARGFARQRADWLVGMNFSRRVTLAGGTGERFSVGRVQSAVLAAVVDRRDRAANFVSTPYNELELTLEDAEGITVKAVLVNPESGGAAFPVKSAYLAGALERVKSRDRDLKIAVTSVRNVQRPDKLFDLTALQKAAYRRYGYSPDETLEAAQALYEKLRCLSYPRTPSRVMGDGDAELFREKYRLLERAYGRWSRFSIPALINGSNKRIFDSAALEDHHALIPLDVLPEGAAAKEKNVFELVVKQFFGVCMADFVWNEHNYRIQNGSDAYRGAAREAAEMGWKAAFSEEGAGAGAREAAGAFDCESGRVKAVRVLDKKTSPPKLFRIDTLLAFMEKPKAEEGAGGKTAGLGTPATRAEIIKSLFERKYILEEKKRLVPTGKGAWLIKRLRADESLAKLADAGETAAWEDRLEKDPRKFEESVVEFVKAGVRPGAAVAGYEREAAGPCPLCGSGVYEGKKSYFCSAWNDGERPCGFTIWKEKAGAEITAGDAGLLLAGKETGVKKCVSKGGKEFRARFRLGEGGRLEFSFHTGNADGLGSKRGRRA
jgi:DNA topoisomerase-3